MRQARSAEFVRHGGRIDEARRTYPHAPAPWLDLSTGINPFAWHPDGLAPVDQGPLPSIAALAGLEAAAARFFGVPPARVAAVPGSEVALRLLPALGLPAPIVTIGPGYGTHAAVADERAGVDALDAPTAHAPTLLLANPNNPDGRIVDRAALRTLVERRREEGGWLVVDEAFADADPDLGIAPHLGGEDRVIVLRSFGKFFGLAGLRLGFVLAPPGILERVRMLLGDWPVGTQAIAWGTAAYGDADWIGRTRIAIAAAATGLDRMLARHGLAARGACPLFRLVEHPDAAAVFERLAAAGILTRPFDDRPDWLRFGLPDGPAALDRLDRALAAG